MRDLLVKQGFQKALVGKKKKLASMKNKDWEDLDARSLNTIRLCLADEVLFNITRDETTIGLWSNMEIIYMTKSSMNKIFLKRKFYRLQMKKVKNCRSFKSFQYSDFSII